MILQLRVSTSRDYAVLYPVEYYAMLSCMNSVSVRDENVVSMLRDDGYIIRQFPVPGRHPWRNTRSD